MHNLPGHLTLRGAMYFLPSRMANISAFVDYCTQVMGPIEAEPQKLIRQIETFLKNDKTEVIDQASALRALVKEDLAKGLAVLKDDAKRTLLEENLDIQGCLEKNLEWAKNEFAKMGVKVPECNVFVVDKVPKLDNPGVMAVNVDLHSAKKYGIARGMYFAKAGLRPFITNGILFHEMVHNIMNPDGEPTIGGNLEEGLAELFGAVLLPRRLWGSELVETMMSYHRLATGLPGGAARSNNLYLDQLRTTYATLITRGGPALIEILQKGRTHMKALESEQWLHNEKMWPATAPKLAPFEQADLSMLTRLLLVNSCELVSSPLAVYMARFLRQGVMLKDVAKESGIPLATLEATIKDLEYVPRYIEMVDGEVSLSECERLNHPLRLRYFLNV